MRSGPEMEVERGSLASGLGIDSGRADMASERGSVSDDAAEPPDQEVAADVAADPEAVIETLPHLYRAQCGNSSAAQSRMDRTTNWAITVQAALVSITFSRPAMPAYLLLIGLVTLAIFLSYEVRRYRFYDLYRARVRFLEENVYANLLHPIGAEHGEWRQRLSRDLRRPTFKVSALEALSRRLRRIYALLFVVLGIAWGAKVTLLTPQSRWDEAAAIHEIPASAVVIGLAVFYVGVALASRGPRHRQAKGKIHATEAGVWKTS